MLRAKLLLFDLDGVLADYSRERRCRHLAEAVGIAPAQAHDALFRHGLEARSDRGEIRLDDYMEALRTGYGWTVPAEEFVAARRAATSPNPAMLALCASLSGQSALGVFTNNGRWLLRHAEQIVPELLPLFGRRMVCSADLGACKPDPEAFAACVNRLGFTAASSLMIDDNADNVEGARRAGLDAIRFEGIGALAAALRERGFDA